MELKKKFKFVSKILLVNALIAEVNGFTSLRIKRRRTSTSAIHLLQYSHYFIFSFKDLFLLFPDKKENLFASETGIPFSVRTDQEEHFCDTLRYSCTH